MEAGFLWGLMVFTGELEEIKGYNDQGESMELSLTT